MIRMIALSDCPKSQYYSKMCVERWGELGYNIRLFQGTTPDTLGDELEFADIKMTSKTPFTPTEKAIWYSHFRVWQTVKEPTYIIEHDTYPFRLLPEFKEDYGLFSVFPRNNRAWLKMEEHISPGSGYYISERFAAILTAAALEDTISQNVDGHIHTHFEKELNMGKNKTPKQRMEQLNQVYCPRASCFQIVNYDIGTSAEHKL
jgi:hypothetical protein